MFTCPVLVHVQVLKETFLFQRKWPQGPGQAGLALVFFAPLPLNQSGGQGIQVGYFLES